MSSGFISETEIEQRRKQIQEEWERVRKPDDPLEAPKEEPQDTRSLFERLKEQKDKKQEEFEEAHKLKNLVKVLDDDEIDFLDFVDRAKLEEEKRKREEEKKELTAFRDEVSKLREEALQKHILQEIGLSGGSKSKTATKEELSIGTSKKPQTKLLAGIVKRKAPANGTQSSSTEPEAKIPKTESSANSSLNESTVPPTEESSSSSNSSSSQSTKVIQGVPYKGNLVCIGVLPGLASYSNSSDSDDDILQPDKDSSDSDDNPSPSPARDLCGRRIVEVDKDKSSS